MVKFGKQTNLIFILKEENLLRMSYMKNNNWTFSEVSFWERTRPKRNRNYLIFLMIGIVIGLCF
jgi:hypothetical protein